MNGFKWKGLVSFSILTLSTFGPAQADQPAVVANEPACLREKRTTAGPETVSRPPEVFFQSASYKCEGDRCYVVDDEATCGETKETSNVAATTTAAELEGILQSDSAPPMVASPLGRSLGGLSRIPKPAPLGLPTTDIGQELMDLRVQNSSLVARLEMTQAILELQTHYTHQILLLERENAKLVAQTAELRVKNEVNEQLTAGLVERTELNGKLTAAHDWISSRTAYEASIPVQMMNAVPNPNIESTIATIQEDLSNLRRQLPLIKRTPVPFAISNTVTRHQPYVPVGTQVETARDDTTQRSQTSDESSTPCREAAAKGVEVR